MSNENVGTGAVPFFPSLSPAAALARDFQHAAHASSSPAFFVPHEHVHSSALSSPSPCCSASPVPAAAPSRRSAASGSSPPAPAADAAGTAPRPLNSPVIGASGLAAAGAPVPPRRRTRRIFRPAMAFALAWYCSMSSGSAPRSFS